MTEKTETPVVGAHSLVWVGGWSEAECRKAVSETKRAGFDLIEIPVMDPWKIDIDMTKAVLDEVGLRASCSLGLSFDADISSEDLQIVESGKRLLVRALEVTDSIGGGYLMGITYSAMGKYPTPPTSRGRANAASVLRELAADVKPKGIQIGLEVVNRYETNLFNTGVGALRFADEIGADNILVQLDTYHMNIEEADFATPVRAVAAEGRLGYVHVGENHRGYLGSGHIDFPQFFRALADVQFDGVVTFESFSSEVVQPELTLGLAIWRDLWEDSYELGSHARSYIAAQILAAQRASLGA